MTVRTVPMPPRLSLLIEADRWWQLGAQALADGDVELGRRWMDRAQAYKAQALKAPDSGGLAAAGASLAGSDGKRCAGAIEESVTQ